MEFLQLAIVGTASSLLVNEIKNKFGTQGNLTKAIVVALALIIAAGVTLLQGTAYWQTFLTILGSASTVYAFLMK